MSRLVLVIDVLPNRRMVVSTEGLDRELDRMPLPRVNAEAVLRRLDRIVGDGRLMAWLRAAREERSL